MDFSAELQLDSCKKEGDKEEEVVENEEEQEREEEGEEKEEEEEEEEEEEDPSSGGLTGPGIPYRSYISGTRELDGRGRIFLSNTNGNFALRSSPRFGFEFRGDAGRTRD